MKICCYEKFITQSSGTAYISGVRDTRRVPLAQPVPLADATARALATITGVLAPAPQGEGNAPPAWKSLVKMGHMREGQVPVPFILSSGKITPQNQFGWILACLRGRLLPGTAAAHPKVPFSFLSGAPCANATPSWEDGAGA